MPFFTVRRLGRVFATLAIAVALVHTGAGQKATQADVLLGRALSLEDVDGRLQDAIGVYQQVLKAPDATRAQKARAQFRIGACYERLGLAEAQRAYEAVVKEFGDQADLVAQAKSRLSALSPVAGVGAKSQGAVSRSERLLWTDGRTFQSYLISPTGDMVAIDDEIEQPSRGRLSVRSVAGGLAVDLTNFSVEGDYAYYVVWSPDGKRIVYQFERSVRLGRSHGVARGGRHDAADPRRAEHAPGHKDRSVVSTTGLVGRWPPVVGSHCRAAAGPRAETDQRRQ